MVTRERGMTMVEVLVALVVATIGLLGTLALLGTLINGSSFSRSMTEASTLVQDKIEQVTELVNVTAAAIPDNTQVIETGLDAYGRVTNPAGPYTRTTTWTTRTDSAGARRHVNVAVAWGTHVVTADVERVP